MINESDVQTFRSGFEFAAKSLDDAMLKSGYVHDATDGLLFLIDAAATAIKLAADDLENTAGDIAGSGSSDSLNVGERVAVEKMRGVAQSLRKKHGELTLTPEHRAAFGKNLDEIRDTIETALRSLGTACDEFTRAATTEPPVIEAPVSHPPAERVPLSVERHSVS